MLTKLLDGFGERKTPSKAVAEIIASLAKDPKNVSDSDFKRAMENVGVWGTRAQQHEMLATYGDRAAGSIINDGNADALAGTSVEGGYDFTKTTPAITNAFLKHCKYQDKLMQKLVRANVDFSHAELVFAADLSVDAALAFYRRYPEKTELRAMLVERVLDKSHNDNVGGWFLRLLAVAPTDAHRESIYERFEKGEPGSALLEAVQLAGAEKDDRVLSWMEENFLRCSTPESIVRYLKAYPPPNTKVHAAYKDRLRDLLTTDPERLLDMLVDGKISLGEYDRRTNPMQGFGPMMMPGRWMR